MFVTKPQFRSYIEQFDFRHLFNQLGWNDMDESTPIRIAEHTYKVHAVAEKSGFRILVCSPDENGQIPEYSKRLKIDKQVTRLFREHLLIFCDKNHTRQLWQLVKREQGKPARLTETPWHKGQEPELLFQKTSNLFFTLDEEDQITIVDVQERVTASFHQNNEKVTKKFYERFKKEHTAFLTFIKGIEDKASHEWYASLMLNRLMFCYFIQKKGFLNQDPNYLRNKLNACQEKRGKNKFYSFYRDFLLALFHSGLGAPAHAPELSAEIGRVPYLNGGLFDEHDLERAYKKINIDDKAFERIFDFFDEFNWHLDTRETASGKDINPDVIGYIFEKYINDRAQMGAYYTKEDITEYISKNCIIPYLFDETRRQYADAFKPETPLWQLLKEDPDRYIYAAVKKGVTLELPAEIAAGLDTAKPNLLERREAWNKPAPDEYALPTEIWREVVERRKRFEELHALLAAGKVNSINDFITYNLDIRQFVQDVIDRTTDTDLLRHLYKALSSVTIIDPTCGSGAFLFAAMNILEPLYDACLQRMRNFTEEEDLLNKEDRKRFRHQYKFFRETLETVQNPELHPHQQYFIYKSIILRNLYGVDIMREAVEIAKLRLFLKLVATVEADYKKPNLGLEPLPDVDFNIRAGNTLVGFATEPELKRGLDYTLDGIMAKPAIEELCDVVAMTYKRYKEIQLEHGNDYTAFKAAKKDLASRLADLNHELNQLMHKQYTAIPYADWLEKYQPFHWFAEFYEIVQGRGGFDVVIGNPPYLEISQISYKPKGLLTIASGAVHNMCIERSLSILNNNGAISMIVPLALVCTQRMVAVQNLLEKKHSTWYSNFAWRPGKLFDQVNRALTIFTSISSSTPTVFTTSYLKWQSIARSQLFQGLYYTDWKAARNSFWVPKLSQAIEVGILNKVLTADMSVKHLLSETSASRVYYRTTGGLYWKIFTNFPPIFNIKGKSGKSSRETSFSTKGEDTSLICIALLSSNTFWWWYTITSNLRDLNPIDIQNFKFPSSIINDTKIKSLSKKYLEDISNNSTLLNRVQKQTGETQTQSFKISLSKPIIDNIDKVIASYYNFTEEELDFIINYDIKYRMGKELEEDEE